MRARMGFTIAALLGLLISVFALTNQAIGAGEQTVEILVSDSQDPRVDVEVKGYRWTGSSWSGPVSFSEVVGKAGVHRADLTPGDWSLELSSTINRNPVGATQSMRYPGNGHGAPTSAPDASETFSVGGSALDLGTVIFKPIRVPWKLRLENGAAQVGRTFDANAVFPDNSRFIAPQGTQVSYQWYVDEPGAKVPFPDAEPIPGATEDKFTVTQAQHGKILLAEVRVIGETTQALRGASRSGVTSKILHGLSKPVMPANLLVGATVTAKYGEWVDDYQNTITWRRDNVGISGYSNLKLATGARSASYKIQPADGGKSLSLLTLAENGNLIDRVATFSRVRFRSVQTITTSSPAKGQVKVTVKMTTPYLDIKQYTPIVRIYRGTTWLGNLKLINGTATRTYTGQPSGATTMKTYYPTSTLIAGSSRTAAVTIG